MTKIIRKKNTLFLFEWFGFDVGLLTGWLESDFAWLDWCRSGSSTVLRPVGWDLTATATDVLLLLFGSDGFSSSTSPPFGMVLLVSVDDCVAPLVSNDWWVGIETAASCRIIPSRFRFVLGYGTAGAQGMADEDFGFLNWVLCVEFDDDRFWLRELLCVLAYWIFNWRLFVNDFWCGFLRWWICYAF